MSNARENAFKLLSRWNVLYDPPTLPERVAAGGGAEQSFAQQWAGMPSRDRAFAFDLVSGVIRWRGLLDAVLASRLKQPIETMELPVLAILWIGGYQLLLQSGTADYAAVDTAVELAKRTRSTAKAAGLVNAVLRGITRLKPRTMPWVAGHSRRAFALNFTTQIEFATDLFPDPVRSLNSYLAAVRSHPSTFVGLLRKVYGDEKAGELLLRNNLRPVIALRVDADAVDVPAAAGLIAHAEAKRFLVAKDGWSPELERLVVSGELSPQDPTAARPVLALVETLARRATAPQRILDLCAGLGTKAIQLARAFPAAQVVASDIDPVKLVRLTERATALKLTNLQTVSAAELGANVESGGRFDAVLADVPCSNTGVMAKRIQSRWRWTTLNHDTLHVLQKNLIAQGAAYLAPGGTLVYATCSIDPDENEKLVRALLTEFPQHLKVVAQEATLPSLTDDPALTHDGGYYAVLQ